MLESPEVKLGAAARESPHRAATHHTDSLDYWGGGGFKTHRKGPVDNVPFHGLPARTMPPLVQSKRTVWMGVDGARRSKERFADVEAARAHM